MLLKSCKVKTNVYFKLYRRSCFVLVICESLLRHNRNSKWTEVISFTIKQYMVQVQHSNVVVM